MPAAALIAAFPDQLRHCALRPYGVLWDAVLQMQPCLAEAAHDATVLALPALLDAERWTGPSATHSDMNSRTYLLSTGLSLNFSSAMEVSRDVHIAQCRRGFFDVLARVIDAFGGRFCTTLLIVDTSPYSNTPDILPAAHWLQAHQNWSCSDASRRCLVGGMHGLEMWMREALEAAGALALSLPLPATAWSKPSATALAGSLADRACSLGFKGRIRKNSLRGELEKRFSQRPTEGKPNWIIDSAPKSEATSRRPGSRVLSTEQVLHNCTFNLVVPGDRPQSYRYGEAMCGGGIPLMLQPANISRWWVFPYPVIHPFSTYGLEAANVTSIPGLLHALNDTRREELRRAAARTCEVTFSSTEAQLQALIESVMRLTRHVPLHRQGIVTACPTGDN